MSLYETISTKLIECDLDSIEIFRHGSKCEVTFEWKNISFEFTFYEKEKPIAFHERNKKPIELCVLTCYTNGKHYTVSQNLMQKIFEAIHNDKELYLEFKSYLRL